MPRTRPFLTFLLLAILALVSAIPHAPEEAPKVNDDFWEKKPMHTTELMAGTARTTAQSSTTRTQTPTAATRIQTSDEVINEL